MNIRARLLAPLLAALGLAGSALADPDGDGWAPRRPGPKPMPASEEIINMLAQAPNVLEFNPSEKARQRVWELLDREKQGDLTEDEKNELEHYAQIEHVMRLVKAQARKQIPADQARLKEILESRGWTARR